MGGLVWLHVFSVSERTWSLTAIWNVKCCAKTTSISAKQKPVNDLTLKGYILKISNICTATVHALKCAEEREIHALPLFSSIIRGTPGPGCFLGRTLQVRTVTFSLIPPHPPPHPQVPILLLFALGCNSVCLHTCVDTAYLTETHRANRVKSKVSKCAPDKQVHWRYL